nr:hypothetical protein 7 [bacterium]BDD46704.1 hypothetical protein 15 [Paracoccaceae bacterium]BDD46750.1 hypothetical protein 3 [Paracoccaceae bacterium]
MLEPEDFEIPLEKQLRLQVIKKEIQECNDIDALKNHLCICAESLMKYQQVAAKLAEKNLHASMHNIFSRMGIEVLKDSDA